MAGIYEDMNSVIAWAHYWAGTNANDTLREYIAFEFSAVPKDVEDVMKAIGLLEVTWTTERTNKAMTAEAYALLSAVDKRLTSNAKQAWRWRILLLRAEIDATLAANGGEMWGPVLCRDMAELTAIQHANKSSCCRPSQAPCTKPPPGPPPAPAHGLASKCPDTAFNGSFVPWVRAVNSSNVFGVKEGVPNVGIPFLGVFSEEEGCKKACEALSNCTQYEWAGRVDNSPVSRKLQLSSLPLSAHSSLPCGTQTYSPWNNHCYGRCDRVWKLHATPHGGVSPVSARRVEPEPQVAVGHKTDDAFPSDLTFVDVFQLNKSLDTCYRIPLITYTAAGTLLAIAEERFDAKNCPVSSHSVSPSGVAPSSYEGWTSGQLSGWRARWAQSGAPQVDRHG